MLSLKTIRCGFLLICAWPSLLISTIPSADAQTLDTNSDSKVLTTQLEQMHKEIQFLRRQVDSAVSMESRFPVLVKRMTSAEASVEALSQKIKELIELDEYKSRQIQLLERHIATLALGEGATNGLEAPNTTDADNAAPAAQTSPNLIIEETATEVSIVIPAQRTVTTAISATSIMDGALLNPGPAVPIIYHDEQGDISRPIPTRRAKNDLDPQPLNDDEFTLLRTQAVETITKTQTTPDSSSDNSKAGKESDTPNVPLPSTEIEIDIETAPDISPVQQQYGEAYALIEQSQWLKAEEALKAFLHDHPNHPLASNASYWLGESFYARNLLNDATRVFAANVRDDRTGQKAPDSLLKLSITLAAQEKLTEACRLLAFLPIEYPQADKALLMKATSETERLGCS